MKNPSPDTGGLRGDTGISEREIDLRAPRKSLGGRIRVGIDLDNILRALVCAALLIFFALLQTTIFTRFRPFGAVPDLMLPLVIAVAMTERERWGAIFGVAAAFVIESLGGATVSLLALLYMPAGYVCGILAVQAFRDSAAVRALFTLVACAAHMFFTLLTLVLTVGSFNLASALLHPVLSEFAASLLFAALPHLAAKAALRIFHREREEIVD